MDYYEEFGIPRSAAPDEIRQAHRSLVRLLHPDQFQDPALKRLAEGQMKRVNEIFAVLSDPLKRRQYDEPARQPQSLARYWQWAGWCAAVLIAAVWLSSTLLFPPAPAAYAWLAAPGVPGFTGTRRSQSSQHIVRPPVGKAARQLEASPPPRDEAHPPRIEEPLSLTAPTVVPAAAPSGDAPPPQPAPPVFRPKGMAGRWFYLRPHVLPVSKEIYPPEYIEVGITENAGILRGRYHARYKVTDRAISPEVTFQFEGTASSDSTSLPWSGGGGARGEVHLRRLSQDSLEVKWFATQLGKQLGLASGAAVLVRSQEP